MDDGISLLQTRLSDVCLAVDICGAQGEVYVRLELVYILCVRIYVCREVFRGNK
jgi:hypothetical protein